MILPLKSPNRARFSAAMATTNGRGSHTAAHAPTGSPDERAPKSFATIGEYPRGDIDRHVRNRYHPEASDIGRRASGTFSPKPSASVRSTSPSMAQSADTTRRHLRGASGSGHAAAPRGLLADAGRGAGCVQQSGPAPSSCGPGSDRGSVTGIAERRHLADASRASDVSWPRHSANRGHRLVASRRLVWYPPMAYVHRPQHRPLAMS